MSSSSCIAAASSDPVIATAAELSALKFGAGSRGIVILDVRGSEVRSKREERREEGEKRKERRGEMEHGDILIV